MLSRNKQTNTVSDEQSSTGNNPHLSAGVVVQGIARLRYNSLKPLYQSKLVDREVAVHWHYVNESVGLFLFYFLQLTVMATYVSQEMVKLVPLLTIIFVFGRYECFPSCSLMLRI